MFHFPAFLSLGRIDMLSPFSIKHDAAAPHSLKGNALHVGKCNGGDCFHRRRGGVGVIGIYGNTVNVGGNWKSRA